MDISLAPLAQAIAPILQAAAAAIVTGLVGLAFLEFKKKTGIEIDATMQANVQAAAANAAGRAVAAADDNLAKASISISSPVVASAVGQVIADAPDEVKALNLSADDVKRLIAAEIGKLQAQMATAPATKAG